VQATVHVCGRPIEDRRAGLPDAVVDLTECVASTRPVPRGEVAGDRLLLRGEDIDLCTRIGRGRAVVYHPGIEIVHHGRAGSRQRIGYVYAQTIIGVARSMRKAGASSTALTLYKLVVTLDEPLHWLRQLAQYLWRRAHGRPAAAERSLAVLHGIGGFLAHGLPEFWRI